MGWGGEQKSTVKSDVAQVKITYAGSHGKFEGLGFLIPFLIQCKVLLKLMAIFFSNNPGNIFKNSELSVCNFDL